MARDAMLRGAMWRGTMFVSRRHESHGEIGKLNVCFICWRHPTDKQSKSPARYICCVRSFVISHGVRRAARGPQNFYRGNICACDPNDSLNGDGRLENIVAKDRFIISAPRFANSTKYVVNCAKNNCTSVVSLWSSV